MSTVTRTRIAGAESTVGTAIARVVLGASLLALVGAWAVLLGWVDGTATVGGVSLLGLLGGTLVLVGSGLLVVGVGSRVGTFDTAPSSTAGVLTGLAVAPPWAVLGGLVATRLLDWTPIVLAVAGLFGVGISLVAVLTREDIGSTVPVGTIVGVLGGAIALGGTPDWTSAPSWSSAVFPGSELVPLLVVGAALLGAWSAAKATAGFGADGRQAGAYVLVGTVVGAMLAVLGLLVAFIVKNGLGTVLTGASLLGGTLRVPERLGLPLGATLPVPFGGTQLPWMEFPFLMHPTGGLYVDIPGVWPAVVGTLWLVVGAVVFAVPLGIGAAIFLSEYAERGRFTQVVEVATNGLWSTPSIVFGLFGLALLVPRISGGNSIVVGQLVLGFMLLPLVLITSREAIIAVPDEYRDASAALGVTKWQTIRSVVLPAAMPGTITGIILGVGRIAGETAPLLLVFGGAPYPSSAPNVLGSFAVSSQPPFVTNDALLAPASALPYQLYSTITAGAFPKDTYTTTEFGWGTALVLLGVVVGLYAIGVASRRYFRRKLHQ